MLKNNAAILKSGFIAQKDINLNDHRYWDQV